MEVNKILLSAKHWNLRRHVEWKGPDTPEYLEYSQFLVYKQNFNLQCIGMNIKMIKFPKTTSLKVKIQYCMYIYVCKYIYIYIMFSFGLCGRGRGWDDLREWHWNMYNIIYETSCQPRFNARYWMLGAGALGRPRGMIWG